MISTLIFYMSVFLYGLDFEAEPFCATMESDCKSLSIKYLCDVNSFLVVDPQQLNAAPYTAFNNSPNNYVDLNGEAPLSTADILVPEFGEEGLASYTRLDEILGNWITLFNHPIYQEELTSLERRVNQMIRDRIPSYLPPRFKEKLASVYKMSRREILKTPRYYEEVQVRRNWFFRKVETVVQKVEYEFSYNYYHNFTDLEDLAALSYMENTGIARNIFEQEAQLWNNFGSTINNSVHGTLLCEFPLSPPINSQEMVRLYENDEYVHALNLRGLMNINFALNNEPGHSIMDRDAYRHYIANRGHNVTAYSRAFSNQSRRYERIPESAVSTPFRPLMHLPISE